MGGTWDYLAETIYPLAAKYKVSFVTPSNPAELISEEGKKSPYVMTTGLTLKAEKDAISSFIKSKKITSVALLYPDLPWGLSHAKMMKDLCKELKVKVLLDKSFPYEGYLDAVKVLAQQIAKKEPSLVYMPIDARGLDAAGKVFEERKFFPVILTSQHLHTAISLAPIDSSRYAKSFGVYPKLSDSTFPERFESESGVHWWPYAGSGYDAVMTIYNLNLAKGRSKDKKGEFSLSKDFEYKGISGQYSLPMSGKSLGVAKNTAQIVQFRDYQMIAVK